MHGEHKVKLGLNSCGAEKSLILNNMIYSGKKVNISRFQECKRTDGE